MGLRSRIIVVRPEYLRWNVSSALAHEYRVEVAHDTDPWRAEVEDLDVVVLAGPCDEATLDECAALAGRPGALVVVSFDEGPDAELAFLQAGADDVVPATVPPDVLRARVEVQVRHRNLRLDRVPDHLQLGALRLDRSSLLAEVDGRSLGLGPNAFRILYTLAYHAGDVVATRTLFDAAGSDGSSGDHGNAIRIAVSRLRRALGTRPDVPVIETVRLVGYRLLPPRTGVAAS